MSTESRYHQAISPEEASHICWDEARKRNESDKSSIRWMINEQVSKFPVNACLCKVAIQSNRLWRPDGLETLLPIVLDEYREKGWRIEPARGNWLVKLGRALADEKVFEFTRQPP